MNLSRFDRTVLTIFASILLLLAAGYALLQSFDDFHPIKLEVYGRPDIKKPARGAFGNYETSDKEQVIYEYLYEGSWITSERSKIFVLPLEYLEPFFLGPAQYVGTRFDLQTGRGWRSMPQRLRWPENDDDRTERDTRHASASVYAQRVAIAERIKNRKLKRLNAARSNGPISYKHIPTGKFSSLDRLKFWIGKKYCGFDMYEREPRGSAAKRAQQQYPFSEASIFVKTDGSDKFKYMVKCNQRNPYAICSAEKGEGMIRSRITFSGEHLCRTDEIFQKAEELFQSFLVSETDARPGWGKPPGFYGEKYK